MMIGVFEASTENYQGTKSVKIAACGEERANTVEAYV
jgi:hypothetical protein